MQVEANVPAPCGYAAGSIERNLIRVQSPNERDMIGR